jgi:hypothetical protein
MAFNIYKWRRDQLLTENSISSDAGEDDLKKYRKQVLQQLLSWYKTQSEPDAGMVKKLESEIGSLNENEDSSSVIVKKIKDLTWEDVDGLALPTKTSGVLRAMKATKDLDSWKNEFKGNELELEVTVDKGADMWFNKVKIEKLTQSDPMGFQAKKDIEKGRPTPD